MGYKTAIEELALQRASGAYSAVVVAMSRSMAFLQAKRYDFLHPEEVALQISLNNEKAKYSYLIGRYVAKRAVSAYTGHRILTDIRIDSGVFCQPVLNLPFSTNLQLSLSHSESFGMALVFPETHPMGIDVEPIAEEKMEMVSEVITPDEWKQLRLLNIDECSAQVMLWTIKEALSKVMRTGLMTSFYLYEVATVEQHGMIRICSFTHFPQYKSLSWISCNHAWSIVQPKNSNVDLTVLRRFSNATEIDR